jgi:hypothetical protein
MSGRQAHLEARPRPARTRRRAWLAVPVVVLTASVFAGLAGASGPGAGGTASPLAEPPTAAEVRAWEEAFLRGAPAAKAPLPPPAKAPGRRLFPQNRVLSLYGAAGGFGVIGRKSVNGAGRKLNKQIKPYRKRSNKPVVKAFDLVAVIATQCSSRRDKCRTRVSNDTIRRYLRKIRELGGRLILDIQPGRANVLDEINHLRGFLDEPDVDVALDAEWNVGPRGEPGQDLGSLNAKKINKATTKVRKIINNHDLPPKLLIIHQFREDSVKGERRIRRPDKVDVTLNFDGIGSPSAKRQGYKRLSFPGLFDGFSLFYKLDQNLMSPPQVMGLKPKPDYIMYQ